MKRFINKYGINNIIYILPFTILFLIFIAYPIINNFYTSFFKWDGLSPDKIFIGFQNYFKMFNNRIFFIALKNNMIFLVLTVIFQNGFGFLMALLLNRKIAGRNIYRSIIFFPCIMAPVIVGYIFVVLLNFSYGVINNFFRGIGLNALVVDWIGKPSLAIFTIIFTNIWQWTGFAVVLYLAGLQNIPEELYEAAKIDGASYFQRTIKITFPMLTSTHFSLLILTSIGAIKSFDLVYAITMGGPAHASEVLSTHIYLENFVLNHTGYATTVSITMFLLALIISIFQLRLYKGVRI